MNRRPRIGLTMRLEIETRRYYLGRDYSEALEAAGAVPVHLPLIPNPDFISAALSNMDGILLPGSDTDVDPARFGEDPHPKLKKVIPEKDETDLLVLAEAERLNLPVLAICFGMQSLNVSRGGTLYQDIESQIDGSIKHDQGIPLDRKSHEITIERGSLLGSISPESLLFVNTHHHQAIKEVGRDLRATARTNDGVVECIEDTRNERYVLGVQWHPELSWESDELSTAVFRSFIEACTERAGISAELQGSLHV